ncbi:MAG TPA: SpoIIE family protein phosphatase, partial [Candidatus Ozemobacteraceae bacterium]
AARLADDRLWIRSSTGDVTIIASLPVPDTDLGRLRRGVVFGGLFAALFAFFLVRQAMETAVLRLKLAVVFMLASALPIAGLGYLGFRMLRDRRDTRVTNVGNAGRELLMQIDREFDQELLRHGIEFRRIRDDQRWITDPDGANASATEMVRDHRLGKLELRDRFGAVAGGASDPVMLEGLDRIFASFCCVCMERALPPGRLSLGKQTIDPMARLVFDSPEMGFPYIISHPDTVHLFRIGTRSFLWYWDVYRDPGHPFAFINLAQDTRDACRRYLERRFLSREAVGDVAWRLVACETARELWYPDLASGVPSLVSLAARVRLMGQTWNGRIPIDGASWLATALPGERLAGFTLFALFPEAELDREQDAGRGLLLLAMAIILLVAFLTGGILADTFLVPVGDLSRGLAALRKRRFDISLEAVQKDELGDLMTLFNEMAGRLREMDMARCVQEALMPARLPQIPGWEFDLFHQTASDLGGDYGDVLSLPDGSLLFIMGDVTGHGAGSALLMVMVKTAVFRFAESGGEPEELMRRLNALIFRLMKRRKMMTCVIGRLDPGTARLQLVNAGHPYPLRCSPEGGVSEITSVGFPLGVGDRKLRLQPVELTLGPGETIVLYTDGLVEGLDAAGNMFGYERIFGHARAGIGLPAARFREGIIGAFRRHHPDPRLEDDLTLIVIRRHE